MNLIVVGMLAVILFLFWVVNHQHREIRQRDEHLAWVDRRDEKLVSLFLASSVAVKVPKSNPLGAFMQHGMISKDAIKKAPELFPMLAERIEVLNQVLMPIADAVKAVENWERRYPAPPVSLQKVKAANRKGRV